jgi:hypothetical protein
MRRLCKGLLAISFLVGAAQGAYAKCGDQASDAADVLAAREQVQRDCNCAGAASHGDFVNCAAGIAKMRVDSSLLPPNCKGAVTKCAARSVCGKPGRVTCCITKGKTTKGKTSKCKTKKDADHCTANGGVVTGTSTSGCASCCDACPAPGAGPSCVSSPSGAFD